jgi:hypothetical protein
MHRKLTLTVIFAASLLSMGAAQAATCAAGVRAAGCAGPNGAVAVRHAPVAAPRCAAGARGAACVGPNGAAAVSRPPAAVRCTIVNGRRVCRSL